MALRKGIVVNKCLRIYLIVVTFFVFPFIISGKDLPGMSSFNQGITNPGLSWSGKKIIYSGEDYFGLYVLNLESEKVVSITQTPGAGYKVNFSFDGTKIGFKLIDENGFQQPVYYDVDSQKNVELYNKSIATGVPTFSNNGSIAFTIGSELIVLNKNLIETFRFNIGNYANLAPISPDGKKVVFNDENDQLWILELETGRKFQLTYGSESYFNPVWSRDSKRIAFSSINGFIFTYDLNKGEKYTIGRGNSVSWLENSTSIIFCEQQWDEKYQLISSVPVQIGYNGENKKILMDSKHNLIRFAKYSSIVKKVIYEEKNQIVIGEIKKIKNQLTIVPSLIKKIDDFQFEHSLSKHLTTSAFASNKIDATSFQAPYIHQVYDTPNWFNGHWACGATSAMMALAYYDVLPAWPCNCSSPYSHQSKYGRYICENYSFNGYTYDIGGYDPNSNLGYGGYGFIIQNNWADTKGNMAKYVRQHGLGSTVDWSPGYSKFQSEIDQEFPVVILNSLTSSGHYILGIGYNNAQKTVVVNDPYGNKNDGYMNYRGRSVIYDWPGYNSGHANLNIVHCLIYMQLACDLVMSPFSFPDTLNLGENIPLTLAISNIGKKVSDSCTVNLYMSSNSYFNKSDDLLESIWVPEIAENDSIVFQVNIAIPDSQLSKKWAIGALVDANNDITEISESNNLKYSTFILKGYPELYRFVPSPDEEIFTSKPEISAHFKDVYFGIVSDSIKLYLDGQEIAESSEISSNKIIYIPKDDLYSGIHTVKMEVQNTLGYKTIKEWQFQIITTDVEENTNSIATKNYALSQNYPNPFNSSTQFQYKIAKSGWVRINIYSLEGKLIKTLVDGFKTPGTYQCHWNGLDDFNKSVASGIYFYRINTKNYNRSCRMIYLK